MADFMSAQEDECFPAVFSFPGVLKRISFFFFLYGAARADSRAHLVNAYAECVRTIK